MSITTFGPKRDESDDPIARRRRKRRDAERRFWMNLAWFATVAFIIVVTAGGLYFLAGGLAGRPSSDWSEVDLLDHLNRQGLNLGIERGEHGAIYFIDMEDHEAAAWASRKHGATSFRDWVDQQPSFLHDEYYSLGGTYIIRVRTMASPKDARDEAKIGGQGYWPWGRFLLRDRSQDRRFLAKIQKALN